MQTILEIFYFASSNFVFVLAESDQEVARQMVKGQDAEGASIWECLSCGYSSKKNYNMKEHIRVKHLSIAAEYKCDYCQQVCPSRGAHRAHIWRYHKQ